MGKVLQILIAALSVALLSAGAAKLYVADRGFKVPVEVLVAFNNWQHKYNKFYSSPAEEIHRSIVFFANYLKVKSHDPSLGWTVELNHFADMDSQEFIAKYTGLNKAASKRSIVTKEHTGLQNLQQAPTSVDWRNQGAVNPIKNQGSCGSCWAFSANAAFESAAFIAGYTPLYSFSEQQLVDCATEEGNQGCNGGWMTSAFEYVQKVGGLQQEASYPYAGVDQACNADPSKFAPPQISGIVEIKQGDCNGLKTALVQQPVTVAVDANLWSFYKSGIFNNQFCTTTQLNHGVTAIGYGVEGSTPFWIIRNSWGTTWGEQGYMRLNRNTYSGSGGLCGVCQVTAYPEVTKQ